MHVSLSLYVFIYVCVSVMYIYIYSFIIHILTCLYIYIYLCESAATRVFILFAFSRVECQKLTLYPTKKALFARSGQNFSFPFIYVYTYTHWHTCSYQSYWVSLSLSLSPSFYLSHYNIYITLYFRTQKWTVCGWQSSSVICVRVSSEHVCVCVCVCVYVCTRCLIVLQKRRVCVYVCVCFGIKRGYHRLVETPYAAGDMSLSAFHSTSPNHTSS